MKEEQRVYIKGNPSRGAEVIKALTDLGGVNSWSYAGTDEKALYYINSRGKIEYIYDYEFSPKCIVVKEFYRKIELPELKKWKDGELLVKSDGGGKEYIVYSNKKAKSDGDMVAYIDVNDYGFDTMTIRSNSSNIKIASVSDINDFQELLHAHGKEWSFKYKVLVDWIWKPENNEEYWYINEVGEICHTLFNGFLMPDLKRVSVGNCFQTKDDAITARDKIAKILLNK
jgi:hypothetical protein